MPETLGCSVASEAVARIEELQRAGSDDDLYDQELVEAIMTDDGGPGEPALRMVCQEDVGVRLSDAGENTWR